jgi:hypothetical protein
MQKRNNIKELLGPQYLEIMQTQAVGEIAEAMADPTNTDNLRRAMLTMSKIQHELILAWAKANKQAGMFDKPQDLQGSPSRDIVGGIKGGQGGSTSL